VPGIHWDEEEDVDDPISIDVELETI
jgi:hypothetical protein